MRMTSRGITSTATRMIIIMGIHMGITVTITMIMITIIMIMCTIIHMIMGITTIPTTMSAVIKMDRERGGGLS
jgi:hypothetical protein